MLENVIILLVRSQSGSVDLLVHGAWHDIVPQVHRDYVQEILRDFKQRARSDPNRLFKQAATLSVGPVITHAEGADLSSNLSLLSMANSFERL